MCFYFDDDRNHPFRIPIPIELKNVLINFPKYPRLESMD